VNIEYVQEGSIRNMNLVAERDPAVRKQRFDELRRVHRDPQLAKEYLLRSSMIASVRSAAAIA
jgi:3-(3-hydroxy-phenyl)propionate hydroxylase